MPPPAPTSIPMRTTVSSSSIASAMPRLRASAYLIVAGGASVDEDMRVRLLGVGSVRRAGAFDGLLDRRPGLLAHLLELGLGRLAPLDERPAGAHERVTLA